MHSSFLVNVRKMYNLKKNVDPFFSPISWYLIGSYSLVSSLQLPYRLGRGKGPPKHIPTKPHCFLTQCPLNPEASCPNVSEETPYTWQPCQCALRLVPQDILLAKPSRNPDDAGSIVRCPMGLPVATEPGLEPRISSGTASTAMQCLRPLRYSGGQMFVH